MAAVLQCVFVPDCAQNVTRHEHDAIHAHESGNPEVETV